MPLSVSSNTPGYGQINGSICHMMLIERVPGVLSRVPHALTNTRGKYKNGEKGDNVMCELKANSACNGIVVPDDTLGVSTEGL